MSSYEYGMVAGLNPNSKIKLQQTSYRFSVVPANQSSSSAFAYQDWKNAAQLRHAYTSGSDEAIQAAENAIKEDKIAKKTEKLENEITQRCAGKSKHHQGRPEIATTEQTIESTYAFLGGVFFGFELQQSSKLSPEQIAARRQKSDKMRAERTQLEQQMLAQDMPTTPPAQMATAASFNTPCMPYSGFGQLQAETLDADKKLNDSVLKHAQRTTQKTSLD